MANWLKYSEEKSKNSYFSDTEQRLHSFRNMRDDFANIMNCISGYFWNLVSGKFPLSQRVRKNIDFGLERFRLLSLPRRSDNRISSPGSDPLSTPKYIAQLPLIGVEMTCVVSIKISDRAKMTSILPGPKRHFYEALRKSPFSFEDKSNELRVSAKFLSQRGNLHDDKLPSLVALPLAAHSSHEPDRLRPPAKDRQRPPLGNKFQEDLMLAEQTP
jgi:hypothetical protein